MRSNHFFTLGKIFFALSVIAIGTIHLITQNFPAGLLPVPANLTAKTLLAVITGSVLIISGILMLVKKYAYAASITAAISWLILLLAVHLPKLLPNLHDASEWTGVFEVVGLFSGALILAGNISLSKATIKNRSSKGAIMIFTGTNLFAAGLVVFGVLHYLYAQFISMLVPDWMALHLFWAYFVMVAFLAAALSFFIQKEVRMAGVSLSIMFFLWVCILHLPRAIGKPTIEPEWTSLFIALAMSGVALMLSTKLSKPFYCTDHER